MRAQLFSALFLSGVASACPLVDRQSATPTTAASGPVATGKTGNGGTKVDMVAAIKAIMPKSQSCEGADFPDECRTAEQAAPFVSKACADLSDGECAATLSLMGYESEDFRYKHNLGNNPGQGTANMMQINYITMYAADLFGADKVAGLAPDEVLALVTPDETNFGSAAWFLKTQCPDVRDGLKTASDAGWAAYHACIGTDLNDKRNAYWARAKTAFGL
ncbi:hypothetical protein VTI28DRAFT_8227 [Corynascus sepedonium]